MDDFYIEELIDEARMRASNDPFGKTSFHDLPDDRECNIRTVNEFNRSVGNLEEGRLSNCES